MKKGKFSVLMSIYIKENAEYFDQCMKSIFTQTVLPGEIVIVKDGAITQELEVVVEKYQNRYRDLIKIVPLPKNRGLGPALAEGILHCSYELIARMDTDDISRKDRFEKQLSEFKKDAGLDICGSHIKEFTKYPKNTLAKRKVPLNHGEIIKYQKQRSAFNHMTVMYKKSAVLRAGNYQDAPLMEDDLLWVCMIQTGAKCKNINDYLVYVRTGDAMLRRRGGYEYLKKYIKGRKRILETGYINYWDFWKTVFVQVLVALVPVQVRKFVFIKLLR